jgi:hypothetical protein
MKQLVFLPIDETTAVGVSTKQMLIERIRTNPESHIVTAPSVREFLQRWKKPSRIGGGYASLDRMAQSHTEELHRYGYTFVTCHDSNTGREVYYFGETE